MAEIVLQVVALGFERIVVFVLDLPSRTARGGDGGDIFVGDASIGDEGVVVENLASFARDG